jgi:hypothetical protein
MAEAWSKDGINANAIGPGFFPTELTAAVFQRPERAQRNAAQTCIGRNGALDDIDGPFLFLCSDASAMSPAGADGRRGVHRKMKALVYTGPETQAYREVPDPSPGKRCADQGGDTGHLRLRHACLSRP